MSDFRNRRLEDAFNERPFQDPAPAERPLEVTQLDAPSPPMRVFNMDDPTDVEEYQRMVTSPEFMQAKARAEERRRNQQIMDDAMRQASEPVQQEHSAPPASVLQEMWRRYQALLGRR